MKRHNPYRRDDPHNGSPRQVARTRLFAMSQPVSEPVSIAANGGTTRSRAGSGEATTIASPHFQFARRTADIGHATRHAQSSQSLPEDLLKLVGAGEPRFRLDQAHPTAPATHLPRSVVEQYVGWSEVVTTTWTSVGVDGATEPAIPPAPTNSDPRPQPTGPTSGEPALTDEAVAAIRKTADLQAAIARLGLPEPPHGLVQLPATRLEPVLAEGSLAGSAFARKPAPFGQALQAGKPAEAARTAVRPLSLETAPVVEAAPVAEAAPVSEAKKAAPKSRKKKAAPVAAAVVPPEAPSFDLDDIPLFPEPAWPLVSELLLGAGWPFTSRLAEGMERALAGRSNTMLITGVQRAVGASTLCLTLGRWAAGRRRVLVVDADVPACGLTRLLGKSPVRSWPSTSQGRDFVTTGLIRSSRSGIAFASLAPIRNRQLWPPFLLDRLGDLLASVGGLFDLVLVDAGPVSQLAGELSACAALTTCAMVVSGGEAGEEPLIQAAQRRLGELGAERILAARNFSARPLQNAG